MFRHKNVKWPNGRNNLNEREKEIQPPKGRNIIAKFIEKMVYQPPKCYIFILLLTLSPIQSINQTMREQEL